MNVLSLSTPSLFPPFISLSPLSLHPFPIFPHCECQQFSLTVLFELWLLSLFSFISHVCRVSLLLPALSIVITSVFFLLSSYFSLPFWHETHCVCRVLDRKTETDRLLLTFSFTQIQSLPVSLFFLPLFQWWWQHHSSSNGDNIGEEGDHESSSSRKITHEQPESTINSPAVIGLHHQQHHATISSCQHHLPTSSSVGDHLSQEDISSSSSSTTGEGTAVGGQANTTTRETYSSLVETPLLSSLPTTSTSTLSSNTNCSTQPTLEGKDILLPSPLITTTTESESTTTSSISTIPVVKGRGESTATVVDSSCCGSSSGSSSTGSLVGQQQGQPLRKEQSISNPVYRFPKQPTHRFQLPRQELAYYFDQTYLPFYSPTMSSSTIIPSNPPPLMPILGQQQLVPTIVTDQQSPVCSSTMSTYSTTPTSSSSSMSSNVLSPPRYGTTVPNRIFVGGITTDVSTSWTNYPRLYWQFQMVEWGISCQKSVLLVFTEVFDCCERLIKFFFAEICSCIAPLLLALFRVWESFCSFPHLHGFFRVSAFVYISFFLLNSFHLHMSSPCHSYSILEVVSNVLYILECSSLAHRNKGKDWQPYTQWLPLFSVSSIELHHE